MRRRRRAFRARAVVAGGVSYIGSSSYLPTNEEAKRFAIAGAGVLFVVKVLAALITAGLVAGLFPAFSNAIADAALSHSLRRFVLLALLGFGGGGSRARSDTPAPSVFRGHRHRAHAAWRSTCFSSCFPTSMPACSRVLRFPAGYSSAPASLARRGGWACLSCLSSVSSRHRHRSRTRARSR